MPRAPRGDMTVKEAGRIGGNAVKEKYGAGFFSDIGKQGGKAVSEERGPDFFAEIGSLWKTRAPSLPSVIIMAGRSVVKNVPLALSLSICGMGGNPS